MYAFSVPIDVDVVSRHGYRRLLAALPKDAGGGLDPGRVYLAIHDEDALARRAWRAEQPQAGVGLRFYQEAELAEWPAWPMRLGRLASQGRNGALSLAHEPSPLHAQLAALRGRHGRKCHFRIALVGGFGFDLDDTLVGATAWRALVPILRAALPGVSADVLLGPEAHPAAVELIGHEDGVDAVSFTGPSLTDFARYDAYFDFSSLVRPPRFRDMPALDWVLWWLGLDPDAVGGAAKRNRLALPQDALDWARERIAGRDGPRVAFVWRASTPLRSMPDEIAARFAAALLEVAPGITLVTGQFLDLDHPRILDLGRETDSAERTMALVAQADALITIDSLAPHVADAADVPTVMLPATFPPSRFPFYPNMHIVTPPGMDALPGWGVTTVSDERWAGMQEDYGRSWTGVSARACWDLLSDRMAARPAPRDRVGLSGGRARDRTTTAALPPAGKPFARDVVGQPERWIAGEIARFAAQVLGPGKTAVLAGGGDGDVAMRLARLLAPGGELHVLEPRRLRAQKLAADAHAAGLDTLHLIAAMADGAADRWPIPDFDPAGEADPGAWGNLHRGVLVNAMRIDDLPIDRCHALVICAPQDAVSALSGAAGLMRETRTVIVAGPVPGAHLAGTRLLLEAAGYRGSLAWPDRANFDGALLLAAPAAADVRLQGFDPL